MELASPIANDFGSTSADLGIWSNAKKKRVNSVYFHSTSYKKSKNSKVGIKVIDLSAGPLGLANICNINSKFLKFWGSKIESKTNSMSGLSDLENIKNTIAEETSYADLDTSVVNDIENNTTLRKTCICTYMLGQSPKTLLFDVLSNNNNMVTLLSPKFAGSKKLQSVGLHASDKCIFDPVKSFALDIGIFALFGKTIGDKLIVVKKIFYQVDGFRGVSASSKLPGIIKSSFTSELSLIKAKKITISEKILVNIDVRKPNSHSDQKVIVKEISVDLSRLAIELVFSKFGQVISIRMQLIRLWQKALVKFESSDSILVDKDSVHVALLYTLLIGTTAHDLSDLVNSYGEKTCFIGHNSGLYARNRCAVVCFNNVTSKLAAIGSVPVYRGVTLCWTGLSLACCAKYKQFGHIFNVYSVGGNSGVCHKRMVSSQDQVCLANIYKRKQILVVHPVFFVTGGSLSCVFLSVPSGASLFLSAKLLVMASNPLNDSGLAKRLASLECFLELLLDQVSNILKKLSLVNLVLMLLLPCAPLSLVVPLLDSALDLNMAVNSVVVPSSFSLSLINKTASELSLSSSKMLTTKADGLESKMLALKVSVNSVLKRLDSLCSGLVWKIATCNIRGMNNPAKQKDIVHWHKDMGNLISIITETKLWSKVCPWIANRLNGIQVFTSGVNSGNLGSGVTIIMDTSLTCHVCKIFEVLGWLFSVRLLFKNKLSVSILGLYADASLSVQFFQAGKINSMIAKAVNEFFFVVLGGNFNEDGSHKCASFKKCLDFGLVNFFANSCGVIKTINFLFIFSNLVNAVVDQNMCGVEEFFNTNHWAVSVSVGLDGLLDV
ncbi:hypothetical protein G9A89_016979 [Geosiphon pyriformis]|nr:hypothetical protein G9A89_016979 [Geosiphon pyriformis]